jgi:hypothetical protein
VTEGRFRAVFGAQTQAQTNVGYTIVLTRLCVATRTPAARRASKRQRLVDFP